MGIAPHDQALGVVGVAPVEREGPGRGSHHARWGGSGAVGIVPVGVGVARWVSCLATERWVWWASRLWDERDQDVVSIIPVVLGMASIRASRLWDGRAQKCGRHWASYLLDPGVVPVEWEGMWEAHLALGVVPNCRAREMERVR